MSVYRRPPKRQQGVSVWITVINLAIAAAVLLSLFGVFGSVGVIIQNIAFGIFGLSAYAFCLIFIIISIVKLINKRIVIDKKKALRYLPLLIIGILAVHTVTTASYPKANYGEYLKNCYSMGADNAGGVVFGAIVYLFNWAGYNFTLSIFVIAFFAVAFISLYPLFLSNDNIKTKREKYPRSKSARLIDEAPEQDNIKIGDSLFIGTPDGKSGNNKIIRKASSSGKTRDFDLLFPNKEASETEVIKKETLAEKVKNKGSYDILFNPFEVKNDKPEVKLAPIEKPDKERSASLIFPTAVSEPKQTEEPKIKPVVSSDKYANYTLGYMQAQIKKSISDGVEIKTTPSNGKRLGIFEVVESPKSTEKAEPDFQFPEDSDRFERARDRLYGLTDKTPEATEDRTFDSLFGNTGRGSLPKKTIFDYAEEKTDDNSKKSAYDILYGEKNDTPVKSDHNINSLFDNEEKEDKGNILSELPDKLINERLIPKEFVDQPRINEVFNDLPSDAPIRSLRSDIGRSHNPIPRKSSRDIMDIKVDAEQVSLIDSPTAVYKKSRYIAPPEDLLRAYPRRESDSLDEHSRRCDALRNVLLEYGIDTEVDRYTVGPTFTRYELKMPMGVPVKKIEQLDKDIAMRIEAEKVRIEAPIPGKNAVGVEVVNKYPSIVGMREGIRSAAFKKDAELSFLLGVNITGEYNVCNIPDMPHLLVAGTTGAGKSACLNTLICSLLYKYSPDQLRLILIDKKRVELGLYNGLPHLLLPERIYDDEKAINALSWAIAEMERRYAILNDNKVRNLKEYNEKAERDGLPGLPYIVIIIDELADLMMGKKRELEDKIKRLAQLARAAGVHLVFATQRPSVDIITGTIKSNFPSRIAFMVKSIADSKTILDYGGADKLQGKGDMLFSPVGAVDPIRLQGAYISVDEVEAIINYVKNNNKAYFDKDIENEINIVKSDDNDNSSAGDFTGDISDGASDNFFLPALKLAIDNNQASITMLQRRFGIGYARAAKIIDAMEVRKFIGPMDGSKPREVFITMVEYNKLLEDSQADA